MTMLCPRCQVAYQDGQICPSCRGYLVPYQPQMQSPAPQPTYEYAPEAAYEAAGAPVAPPPPSKGKTVAIAALSVLVALLTVLCAVLLLRPAPEPEVVEKIVEVEPEHPTAIEQSVADNAWAYTVRVNKVLTALGSTDEPLADVMGKMKTGEWGDAFGQSVSAGLSQLAELVAMSDEGYKDAVDGPMQSLGNSYPDLGSAWSRVIGANIEHASGADDQTVSQEELDRYASLQEGFKQAATDAGFDTSSWKADA